MTAADNVDKRIGARIRAERESRGWSLTELAERSAVSRSMIHKIERGESSPTAALLGKLSGAFQLSMSTLIARAEAQEGRLLRKADQPIWIDPQTGYERRHVSPKSEMPLDLVRIALPAGAQVPMPASASCASSSGCWRANWCCSKAPRGMRCRLETASSSGRRRTAPS
jgi:transcriptional regulator with XRE-family HTH domain